MSLHDNLVMGSIISKKINIEDKNIQKKSTYKSELVKKVPFTFVSEGFGQSGDFSRAPLLSRYRYLLLGSF